MPNVTPELKKQGKKGKEKYMKECVHSVVAEGKSPNQAVAQCLNMWKENWHKKKSKASKTGQPFEEPTWEETELQRNSIPNFTIDV